MQGILATRKDDDLDATAELADPIADASPWQPGISAWNFVNTSRYQSRHRVPTVLFFQQELAAMRQESDAAVIVTHPLFTARPRAR